jgi:3-methyladenine DNA glycosylase AlkD
VSDEIRTRLFAAQDLGYRDFMSSLLPTVDRERVIGVRMPALRKLAGKLATSPQDSQLVADFLAELPHEYYEEDNLHGLLINRIRDYEESLEALRAFLPHVDNWATCDLLKPRPFAKNRDRLAGEIPAWLRSEHTYTERFGVGMLMAHFLDDDAFDERYLAWVRDLSSPDYYVNMMRAWYFATALAEQPAATLPVLERRELDAWTHNKAIQKAIESRRIPAEQKAYLRTLKVAAR